ncbi:MAG: hypothetical protein IPL01_06700 [Acidobacteria bacterium]|nr:hypothetical protein [Acidobacteriota bacterium]
MMSNSKARVVIRSFILLLATIWTTICVTTVMAQREYTVVKPRDRAANETVTASRKASVGTKGVLVVVLDPIIAGNVAVYDSKGKVVEEGKADGESGQVEFELRRGQNYSVKATFPGYLSARATTGAIRASNTIRIKLNAQYARLELPGLPQDAEVFIDDKLQARADQKEFVLVDNLVPGNHTLLVRHPEYNDYRVPLGNLVAGSEVRFFPIKTILVRVAKLTFEGPAGANILIDGAFKGRISSGGSVQIDYQVEQAAEHSISAEMLGYQTWSIRQLLTAGPKTISVKLDPIVTSAGVTDFFDNLSLWESPPEWKIQSDARNKRLEIKGEKIGFIKGKTYRDFQTNFTIWLNDGKGATWVVRADSKGMNYYLFHLSGPSSTNATRNRFYTYLVRDGASPVEVSTPIPLLVDLNTKTSYTISVNVQGFTVKHTITSNDTGETNDLGIWTDTTDTKERFLYGTFGFRSLFGESFIVDDFSLEPITIK